MVLDYPRQVHEVLSHNIKVWVCLTNIIIIIWHLFFWTRYIRKNTQKKILTQF